MTAVIPNWGLDRLDTTKRIERRVKDLAILFSRVDDKGKVWQDQGGGFQVETSFPQADLDENTKAAHLLNEHPSAREGMFRVVLDEQTRTLYIMLDHLLTDGQGLANLVELLVNDEDEDGFTPDEDDLGFPPLVEDVVSVSSLSFLPWLWSEFIESKPATFHRKLILCPPASGGGPGRTLLTMQHVPLSQLQTLLSRCRKLGITIHWMMCAASCLAISELLPLSCTQVMSTHFKIETPMSLRTQQVQRCPLGNYVAPSSILVKVAPQSNLWILAQEMKQLWKSKSKASIGFLTALDKLVDLGDLQARLNSQGRTATVEVSNLGSRPRSSKDWYFAQGNHYSGALFNCNLVSTPSGMNVTVTASSDTMSQSVVDEFARRLVGLLDQESHM